MVLHLIALNRRLLVLTNLVCGGIQEKKKFRSGNVFVNLYNNQWGTNFTEWIEGSFSSKMYIWGYDKYNSASSLITPTEETRTPLWEFFIRENLVNSHLVKGE